MKNHLTHLGGHPLKTDNLDHIVSGAREVFEALGIGIDWTESNGFKLWGCGLTTLTSTDAVWTAGWMYLDGEFCKVDAGSYTKTAPESFKWGKYTVALPIDPQSYENGSSNDVHIEVKAKIVKTSSFVIGVDVQPECGTLTDVINPSWRTSSLSDAHFRAEDAISGAVAWTMSTKDVSWRLRNKTLDINFDLIGTLASAAETLFLKIPLSMVADGKFYASFWVAGDASKAMTVATEDEIYITKTSGDWTGVINVQGQISLRIE